MASAIPRYIASQASMHRADSGSNLELSKTVRNNSESPKISHLSREADKVKAIRETIRAEEKRLRAKYWILSEEWQNRVGVFIYLGSCLIWAAASWAWCQGQLGLGPLIVINALAISILHEMEHDLIHELYFKHQTWVQHVMFMGIWVIKSNAAPWWRKYYHLRHHQHSGQSNDVEERLIGLGMSWWNPKRLFVTLTPAGTLMVANDIAKDDPEFSLLNLIICNSPIITISTLAMLFQLSAQFGGLDLLAQLRPELHAKASTLLPALIIYNNLINFPNVLRQLCLVVISTWSHYYGDIPRWDVFYQTQILDHWILLPFQAFCFNFGATHILHHYVTREPFYLRQCVAFKAIPVLKQLGVRHNDMFNNLRGNRWELTSDAARISYKSTAAEAATKAA